MKWNITYSLTNLLQRGNSLIATLTFTCLQEGWSQMKIPHVYKYLALVTNTQELVLDVL
jgi:hypothetical protein